MKKKMYLGPEQWCKLLFGPFSCCKVETWLFGSTYSKKKITKRNVKNTPKAQDIASQAPADPAVAAIFLVVLVAVIWHEVVPAVVVVV